MRTLIKWMDISAIAAVVNGNRSLSVMLSVVEQLPHLVKWCYTASTFPHTTLLPSTHTGSCQYVHYKTLICGNKQRSQEAKQSFMKKCFCLFRDESFVSPCPLCHPSGWLWEQWRDHEEASIHQGGWGGIGVRGWTLPSPQGASPGQAGPGPALAPALPSALPAAACEDRPTGGRSRPARQPADPCGELQLHAAGPQPSVRSHSCIHSVVTTHCGNLTSLSCTLVILFININRLQAGLWLICLSFTINKQTINKLFKGHTSCNQESAG